MSVSGATTGEQPTTMVQTTAPPLSTAVQLITPQGICPIGHRYIEPFIIRVLITFVEKCLRIYYECDNLNCILPHRYCSIQFFAYINVEMVVVCSLIYL